MAAVPDLGPIEEDATIQKEYDIVVVGGGVAGATFAASLGKVGKNVLMIERDLSEPDRIVGELLQPAGRQKLTEMGIPEVLENIDSPHISGYAIFTADGEQIPLNYPDNEIGRSFHHGRFIQQLRRAARRAPNVHILQGTVIDLIEHEEIVTGVKYRKNGEVHEVHGKLVVVCDGSASVLRKKFLPKTPEIYSYFVGVVMKNADMPFSDRGHVFLASPAPVLMYPISSNEVRVLVDYPTRPDDVKEALLNVTAPQLPKQIQECFKEAVERRFVTMANARLHPDPFIRKGALLVGDAFNMRHPLTGGGMTVAFNDVVILRDLLAPIKDLADYKAVEKAQLEWFKTRHTLAATINVLASALYAVFAANSSPYMPAMRTGCFQYFHLGGVCQSGPVGFLSGLFPSTLRLVSHFFAVAAYGGMLLVFQGGFPWPSNIYRAVRVLSSAASVMFPLLYREHVLTLKHPAPRFLKESLPKQ